MHRPPPPEGAMSPPYAGPAPTWGSVRHAKPSRFGCRHESVRRPHYGFAVRLRFLALLESR